MLLTASTQFRFHQLLAIFLFLLVPINALQQPLFLQIPANQHFQPFNVPFSNVQLETGQQHYSRRLPAHRCKNFCSISEGNSLPCWNDTLNYYEQTIVGLLRRTIATETNRVLWLFAHQQKVDYARLTDESFQQFVHLTKKQQRVDDANDWENAESIFRRISPILLENVETVVRDRLHNHYGAEPAEMLNIECPRGCERSWDTWQWLFTGSMLVSVFLLSALIYMVFRLDQREQNFWTMEAEEIGVNADKVIGRGSQKNRHQMHAFQMS